MAVIEVGAGNTFSLGQNATTNFKILSVTSILDFRQSETEVPRARTVNDTLSLSHAARTTYGSRTVSVASVLSFFQGTHPKVTFVEASNYFALGHTALHPFFEDVEQQLLLEQVVSGERAYGPSGTLALTQNAIGNLVRTNVIVHSLNLRSLVSHFLLDRRYYVTTTPIPPSPPNLVYFQSGVYNLALPRPEIGNTLNLNFTRVNRRSRGGDLIMFRDEQWPRTKTLGLTFAWLTEDQKQTLLRFMQDTIGQVVVYLDHYGHTWDGFIMTPAAKIVQESKNNKTVSLEFQGVRR